MLACNKNSLEVIKLLIEKHPSVIEQVSDRQKTGYDYLSNINKKSIVDYIVEKKLNVRKPQV